MANSTEPMIINTVAAPPGYVNMTPLYEPISYHMCEQRRPRRNCAKVQSRQSLVGDTRTRTHARTRTHKHTHTHSGDVDECLGENIGISHTE